jgi:hypothetical protein
MIANRRRTNSQCLVSARRRQRQNLAEAARDDYVLARFQHPDTHHDLIGIFGNASARLRGTSRGI